MREFLSKCIISTDVQAKSSRVVELGVGFTVWIRPFAVGATLCGTNGDVNELPLVPRATRKEKDLQATRVFVPGAVGSSRGTLPINGFILFLQYLVTEAFEPLEVKSSICLQEHPGSKFSCHAPL